MITQWKEDEKSNIKTVKTKQFKTGLYIWLDNGETSASYKKEVDYHKDLRDKLVGQGFELIPVK